VSEYLLVDKAGFEPLGFVMGSCVYHTGLQVARWGQNMEFTVLTQAMYSARELAMSRMRTEAHALGADGVIGFDLRLVPHAWMQSELEFIAEGTAVRYKPAPGSLRAADGGPFTSLLGGQSVYKLLSHGLRPLALAVGICVYHVAHQSLRQTMRNVGQNVEMPMFSQALYTARELAMARMQSDAENAGADGIVGCNISVSTHVWGEHATEFLALGTAVKRDPGVAEHVDRTSPLLALTLDS
jgi:uncharacterized protein YbjQ (UPF0145 family)